MSTVMHKVKDALSSHKDQPTSSKTEPDTTDTNARTQQSTTSTMNTGDTYSSTTDPKLATAAQTGHSMAGAGPDYSSATGPRSGAPQAGGGIETRDFGAGAGAQPGQGQGTTHHTSTMASNDPNFGGSKNPRDAAQVPPSVMTEHIGERETPVGESSFSDHARRHSRGTRDSLHQYGSGSA